MAIVSIRPLFEQISPGLNATLHIAEFNSTNLHELSSCEVRPLTQLRFYLDRLRRSSRPLQAGITAGDRLWLKRRSSHELNQMHDHVNV